MTTANVSEDEQHGGLDVTFCWASLTAGTHGQLRFISVLNSFLCITAVLGNTLIVVALRRECSLHPPSKLLLSNLALTDLCVGHFTSSLCYFFALCDERKLGYLSIFVNHRFYSRPHFLWSVSVDTDCNKRRQTSRSVAGAEIQTSCNFEAHLCDSFYNLGRADCHIYDVVYGRPHSHIM